MYTPTDFIETLPETSTRTTYRIALKRYLEIVTDKTISNETLDQHWTRYLKTTKAQEADLQFYAHKTRTEHTLSPKTIRLYAQIAVMYMKEAGVTISSRALRIFRTKTPKNKPVTKDAELDRVTLQKILLGTKPKMKAEILIAVSSGMRIGEILSITTEDIDLQSKPATINLRAQNTKTKTARTVFISTEAAKALTDWISQRQKLIDTGKISAEDKRIFPCTKANEIAALRRHLKITGLLDIDTQTNRAGIHFHLFRKYFLTEFKLAASAEVAEELAGHEGYLSDAYRRLSMKTMREEYLKAEPNLTVFPEENLTQNDTQELIIQMRKQIGELNRELNRLIEMVKV